MSETNRYVYRTEEGEGGRISNSRDSSSSEEEDEKDKTRDNTGMMMAPRINNEHVMEMFLIIRIIVYFNRKCI